MDVNGITSVLNVNANNNAVNAANNNTQNSVNQNVVETKDQANAEIKDVYEPSDKTKPGERVFTADEEKIRAMWQEQNEKVASYANMVEKLFNKQAEKGNAANGGSMGIGNGQNAWKGTQWENDVMIEIDDETRAKAQADVAEGGYYSVNETAKRLLDFAVALSGGDPSKIDTLKGAVEKGFKAVEKMFGGELPEISQQTFDATMKGFDEWEKAGDASAISLLSDN